MKGKECEAGRIFQVGEKTKVVLPDSANTFRSIKVHLPLKRERENFNSLSVSPK